MSKLIVPRPKQNILTQDVEAMVDRLVLHKELNLPSDLDDSVVHNMLMDEGRRAFFEGDTVAFST